MGECCLKGFQWTAKTKGREENYAGFDCYVTGSNTNVAIFIVHDLFGWTFPNTRILADHYADEVDATVYVPDFFEGEIVPPENLMQQSQWTKIDLSEFIGRNSKMIREPEILRFGKALRLDYQRVGAIGFCYGGWGAFRLGSKDNLLVDCISAAHPTLIEKQEIENIKVPIQIIAPEMDPIFTEELKAYSTKVIPTLGVAFDYQYFPGLEHGFATRGNPNNPGERKGMERAKNAAVLWFRQWLHGN